MLIFLMLIRSVGSIIVCGIHPGSSGRTLVHSLSPGQQQSFYCSAREPIQVQGTYVQSINYTNPKNIIIQYEAPRMGGVLYTYDIITCSAANDQYLIYIRFQYDPVILTRPHKIYLPAPGVVFVDYPFMATMYPHTYDYRYILDSQATEWKSFSLNLSNPIIRVGNSQDMIHQLRATNSELILEATTQFIVAEAATAPSVWNVVGLDYGEFIQLLLILTFYICVFVINELISYFKNKV